MRRTGALTSFGTLILGLIFRSKEPYLRIVRLIWLPGITIILNPEKYNFAYSNKMEFELYKAQEAMEHLKNLPLSCYKDIKSETNGLLYTTGSEVNQRAKVETASESGDSLPDLRCPTDTASESGDSVPGLQPLTELDDNSETGSLADELEVPEKPEEINRSAEDILQEDLDIPDDWPCIGVIGDILAARAKMILKQNQPYPRDNQPYNSDCFEITKEDSYYVIYDWD